MAVLGTWLGSGPEEEVHVLFLRAARDFDSVEAVLASVIYDLKQRAEMRRDRTFVHTWVTLLVDAFGCRQDTLHTMVVAGLRDWADHVLRLGPVTRRPRVSHWSRCRRADRRSERGG